MYYYTVRYFTCIFYAVIRHSSMLFIDNKDSVFCGRPQVKSAHVFDFLCVPSCRWAYVSLELFSFCYSFSLSTHLLRHRVIVAATPGKLPPSEPPSTILSSTCSYRVVKGFSLTVWRHVSVVPAYANFVIVTWRHVSVVEAYDHFSHCHLTSRLSCRGVRQFSHRHLTSCL